MKKKEKEYKRKLSHTKKNSPFRLAIKLAVSVNVVLVSSHDHIKITTKLQRNYQSELPNIRLNESPTNRDLKKKMHGERQEEQRYRRHCSYTHAWQIKIRSDVLVVPAPPEELGVPAPHQIPQSRVPLKNLEKIIHLKIILL